jgi:DNA polymerase/3'-5' exonuclease PolX
MKLKHLLATTLTLAGFVTFAQPPAATEDNCYQTYAKLFEDRGANTATDGLFDNVVITMRRGNQADCYVGKVRIAKDTIADIFVKFSDGDAERLQKKWKKMEGAKPSTVVNGISTTMVTVDDELINVIFPDLLKPKKKAYQRAPLPKLD